jgi:UDP-N-acetylglucosamine acyltransferase
VGNNADVHSTAVVGPDVVLGRGCSVGPFCRFDGRVQVGADNRFGTGVVIGTEPADRKFGGEVSGVVVGSGNRFHEYVTVHRSTGAGTDTVIGDGNRVMAYVHIAHNCRVGSGCVLTNGAQLGGHVQVEDGANVGGLTGIHQFTRVGEMAMVGACSYVTKDIPPYVLAAGNPCHVRGLNLVGLKRSGAGPEIITVLKQAFRLVYRSGLNLTDALRRVESDVVPTAGPGKGLEHLTVLVAFIHGSGRGVELRNRSAGPDSQ